MLTVKRTRALERVATILGKDHLLTKRMGAYAWGRCHAEQGPHCTLQGYIRHASILEGFYDCLNLWARDHDQAAQRILIQEWHR